MSGSQTGRGHSSDEGFTLIELLVVLTIIPLLIGAVALATITLIGQSAPSNPTGTAARLVESNDSQSTSTYLVRDVETATSVYAGGSTLCGSGTQILGLKWSSATVSYAVQAASPYTVVRSFCSVGSTPASTVTVVLNALSPMIGQAPPTGGACSSSTAQASVGYGSCTSGPGQGYVSVSVYCTNTTTLCSGSSPYSNVTLATLNVQENQSGFHYAVTSAPQTSTGPAPSSPNVTPPFFFNGSIGVQNCNVTVNGLVATNSSASGAISIGSNGDINSTAVYTTDKLDPPAGVSASKPNTYPSPPLAGGTISDPYQSLTPPTVSEAGLGGGFYGYPVTVESTQWSPSGLITPGVYIVQNGMKLAGGVGVTGAVLIYVTGGNVDLTGGGNATFSALSSSGYWEHPTTSPAPPTLPEPAFWMASGDAGSISLGGNGNDQTINGAIYAPNPNSSISLNGGGSSGGLTVQGVDAGSFSCSGNSESVVAGSALSSGTFDQPQAAIITWTNAVTNKDVVTVTGVGQLSPPNSSTVSVYACGPAASSCTNTTGTLVSTGAVTTGSNGTSTYTSSAFHPTSAGTWCFAAYYNGSTTGVQYNTSSDTSSDGCFSASAPPSPIISYPQAGFCYTSAALPGTCSATNPWTGPVAGTASDYSGGAGLTSVQVAFQAPNGKWWNGTNFSSSSISWQPATNTGIAPSAAWSSWTYPTMTALSFNGATGGTGQYVLEAESTNSTGTTSLPNTLDFTWGG
jgi:prepilin-type N-terminal cleavage/methylation domain-containing protein